MPDTSFQAILWDCDGVLMDSEYLACDLSARVMTEAGYPISTDDFVRRFAGQTKEQIHDEVVAEAGFDVFARIDVAAKNAAQRALFADFLKPIPGVADILETLATNNMKMAVASGSSYERLHYTLDLIDMRAIFGPHIYSAESVINGKPAPDVFLYAADKLNVGPAACLVIEDSLNGVRAGHAAGMTVYGFTGGSHVHDKDAHRADLFKAGADRVFDSMEELRLWLADGPDAFAQ